MSKSRLILFAHGSRDPVWMETFEKLALELAMDIGVESVALAYMEFTLPTLADAVRDAAEDGVRRVKILPLFLSAGGHVSRDIPRLANAARREHPDLEIELLPPVGEYPRFRAMVRDIARSAITEEYDAAEALQNAVNGG
jgi:sirohydrochlorin cobaltochelatase